MKWFVDASDYTSSDIRSVGLLATHRSKAIQTALSEYGADNVFKQVNSGGLLNLVFRLPNTSFYFRIAAHETLFECYIGSGVDADGNLLNPVQVSTGWNRGASGGWGWYPQVAAYFSKTGFFIAFRSPVGFADYRYLVRCYGAGLLYNADGTLNQNECDVWAGNWGYENQDAEQFQRGEWMSVKRWDRANLRFSANVLTRMPFIGFTQFPQGVDTSQSKLYGVKAYSPLAPYQESAMWRFFPGDAFAEGQTVTDEGGQSWYLADRSSPFWSNLMYFFPQQLSIYGTRSALAW